MNPQPTHETPNRRAQAPSRETGIVRYRLTFDAHPKELARRETAGSHVVLLWSRRRHRSAVVVDDDATGELVQLDVRERENPLELFQHPYAYIPTRGEPGRRFQSQPARLTPTEEPAAA